MVNKTQIQKLLANGTPASIVADIVGCTPGYISQLMEDETFAKGILEARLAKEERYIEHDERLDGLEMAVIKNLEASMGLCFKPEILLRALAVVNSAKRRATSFDGSGAPTSAVPTIVINLPPVMASAIKINSNGSVIQVGERDLVTIDTNSFTKLAESHKTLAERIGETYDAAGPELSKIAS